MQGNEGEEATHRHDRGQEAERRRDRRPVHKPRRAVSGVPRGSGLADGEDYDGGEQRERRSPLPRGDEAPRPDHELAKYRPERDAQVQPQ